MNSIFLVQQITKLDLSVLDLREDEELDTLLHQFVRFASKFFRIMNPAMGDAFNESLSRLIAIMETFPHTEAVHLARNRSGKMPYELAFQRHVKSLARSMALAMVQKRAHIKTFNWPDEDKDKSEDTEELATTAGTPGSSAASASSTRRRATSQAQDKAQEAGQHVQPSTAAGSSQLRKARTDRARQHSDSPPQATPAANQAANAPLQSQAAIRTAKSTRTTNASISKEPDAVAGEEEMQQEPQSLEERDECVSCEAQLALAISGSATPLEVVVAMLRVVNASEEHESESHRSLARQALQKLVDVCRAQHRDVLNAAATLTSIPGTFRHL